MTLQNCVRIFFLLIMFISPCLQTYAQDIEILESGQIKNVKDPIDLQDAATKAYIDSKLLSFGVSLGSAGIQPLLNVGYGIQDLLNAGYGPLDIITTGTSIDSLYGKIYQEGLIFYLDDQDTLAGVKGLVAAPSDQGTGVAWGCILTDIPGVPNVIVDPPSGLGAEIGDGSSNTTGILNDCPTSPAASDCTSYMGAGFTDWFLPSAKELNEMYLKIGQGAPVPNTNIGGFASGNYWSSTESDYVTSWRQSFNNGTHSSYLKSGNFRVRAIRAF